MPKRALILTEKQRKFVLEYVKQLKSFTAAAEAAGYSDPSGEVDRLKANPDVMTAIAQLQRAEMNSWRQLAIKAQKTLDEAMDPVIVAYDPKKDEYVPLESTQADRIRAASKVMDHLAKSDPTSLLEKAEAEDKRSRDTIVNDILGSSEPLPAELPNQQVVVA